MTNAVFTRLAILSLAVGWTAFAGLKAGDTALWPSIFLGSCSSLITFFWLADGAEKASAERDARKHAEDEL